MRHLSQKLLRAPNRLGLIFAWMLVWCGVTCLLSALFGYSDSLSSCLLAAAICTIFYLLGHLAAEFPRGDEFIMTRLSMGVAMRTGLPIVALILLKLLTPELFKGAFVFYVAWFYFVGLVIDMGLQLWLVTRSHPTVSSRENNGTV